ncbi:DNA repair protein RecN [Jatrophihabitans endophyticus]|uniref:DNA repair protein RecN n=1 Tax=Jatrophihabitans endophyticus TaxID=1206085 RepID=UPI00093274C6
MHIRGLGVIEDAVLPLGPGLTAVTGETGAGKTMVVTGLLLLFGGRADAARVRTGAAQASVDGRVVVGDDSAVAARVRSAGGELDGGELDGDELDGDDRDADHSTGGGGDRDDRDDRGTGASRPGGRTAALSLRRVVNAGGRSRAFVGGAGAPVAVLGELAERLVAVHGQSDQLRLVRPAAQRAALDRYAGVDVEPYARAFAAWREADARLRERTGRAAELRREADLLAHGVAEIDAIAPEPGEGEELTRLAARLGHADALTTAARTAHDALLGDLDDSGGGDVAQLLAAAARALTQQQGDDAELDALAMRLTDLSALAADLGAELGAYADSLDTDPARLDQIETRRAALAGLVRKYCDEPEPSIDGVLRWAAAARERLAEIDVSDEAVDALRQRVADTAREAAEHAAAVSARRRAAASRLGEAVTAELDGLAMADARVRVDVRTRPAGAGTAVLTVLTADGEVEAGASADGVDDVELLLQPHPGAPELPIARGASGGELSRVMLALEVCLIEGTDGTGSAGAPGRVPPEAAGTSVPTLVFDEVDAGVGGRAAVEVGRRLARLARDRQVLVVTHLAQVAAFADRQVVVDKPQGGATNAGAVTASDVHVVAGDDRVAELARMLAGSDTATAREHAAELLADAARLR